MKQIAEMAGVTRPVVSAVLNNNHDSSIKVSKEKREKILELARSLKYRPNFSAVQLTGKRDKSIGIIHGCYMTGIQSELARLLAIKLRVEDYQAYFVGITDPRHELDTINDFISRGMSGIISSYTLNHIRQEDYPIPITCFSEIHRNYDLIANLDEGIYTLTRHLQAHGHRKIAFVCARLTLNENKFHGYQRAMKEAGVTVPPEWLLELTWNARFADDIRKLIDSGVKAFVLNGDMLAGRFIQWLNENGYRVPEDIAIVSCDGLEATDITRTPLTTVVHPVAALVDGAIRITMNKIEKNMFARYPEPEKISPRYRISRSCGCPAHKSNKLIFWEWFPITLESEGQNIKPIPPELEEKPVLLTSKEVLNIKPGGR